MLLAPGLVALAEEEPGLAGHRREREVYARLGHRYEPPVVGRSAVPQGPADAPGSWRQRSIRKLRLLQGRPRARAGCQVAVAPFRAAAGPFRPVLFQIGVERFPPVLSQVVLSQVVLSQVVLSQVVLSQVVLSQAVLFQHVLFQHVLFQDGAEPAPALKQSHLSPLSPHRSVAVA